LPSLSRREFLTQTVAATAASWLWLKSEAGANSAPHLQFPSEPRERIAIASYPFRDYITPSENRSSEKSASKIEIKNFAAYVTSKFNINKIEPWSKHFQSLDGNYLAEIRAATEQARGSMVNIAVDGEHSPYSLSPGERDAAVQFSKQWIDAAAALGCPSIRTNLPPSGKSAPNIDRLADSLQKVATYAQSKNILVNLENDNPLTEDPLFLVKIIKRVNNPYLHALPDFANSLTAFDEQHAYRGIDAMFGLAYNICHVKETENSADGHAVHNDMAKTFGFLKQHGYKGYCSMEWDSPGDPHQGTADLIQKALHYLS
jgi:sugar phosphate isomerase/epimerase